MPRTEKPIHARLRMLDPDPALTPHTLDQLPEHRQQNLLWNLASSHTRAEVAELMPEYSVRLCRVHAYLLPHFTSAVPGDDGLHHLWHPDHGMVCNGQTQNLDGPWIHKAIFWWKNSDRKERRRTFITQVNRVGDEIAPELVTPDKKCWLSLIERKRNQQGPIFWPDWMGANKPYTRARWAFVQVLGRGCAVCGGNSVGVMDHDQFTGWMRGMLCGHCNNHIDQCPHLEGCRFADYLNDPPGWHLQADYPGLGNKYQGTMERLKRALEKWDPMLFRELRRQREPPQPEGLW